MSKIETRRMVTVAVAACEDKKAEQIRVLELDPSDSGFTDYFVICSGTNERQNQAIATEIEMRMKRDFGSRANSVEGYRQGDWILLDYVDFVVHIFSEEKRSFYDIERLRKTATSLGLDELKASLTEKVAAVRKKHAAAKKEAGKSLAKKSVVKKSAIKSAAKKTASKKTVSKKAPAKKSAKTTRKKTR